MRPLAPLRSGPPLPSLCPSRFSRRKLCCLLGITCPVRFVRISTDVIACINCNMDSASAMWFSGDVAAVRLRPVFRCQHTFTAFPQTVCTYPANATPLLLDYVTPRAGIRSCCSSFFFCPCLRSRFLCGVLSALKGHIQFHFGEFPKCISDRD